MTVTLFAARGSTTTDSDLYTLDPTTGAETSIGTTGGYAFTGLAFDPTDGTLYGVTSTNSATVPHALVTLDPLTAAVTEIGTLTGSEAIADIFFTAAGALYGWSGTFGNGLCSIDKATGTLAIIGDPDGAENVGCGIAADSAGTVYVFPQIPSGGDYFTVDDLATGATTDLGALSGSPGSTYRIAAATFMDGDDTNVYVMALRGGGTGTSKLSTINISTGALTVIATLADTHFDALAWTLPAVVRTVPVRILVAFTDDTLTESPDFTDLAAP